MDIAEAVEANDKECQALDRVWRDLGVLFSGITSRLDKGPALQLCRGLSNETLSVDWSMRPGKLVCTISDRSGDVVARFELVSPAPPNFHFVEVDQQAAN